VLRNTVFNPAAVLLLAMAVVSSVSAVLHGDNPILPYSVVFLTFLAACTVAPRGLGIHVGIGTCCVIAAIASGFAIVVHKDFSVLPCTPDKCGILGFNFRGAFSYENSLAMFLVLAMPFVYIGFASWEGPVLSAYLLGLALLTGSRSGSIAGVVTFVVLILVRPNIRRPAWAPRRTTLVYLVLAVAFVVGLAVPFYTNDPTAYSGRGYIWMLGRDALSDPATLLHGSGMLGWEHVREAGLINFTALSNAAASAAPTHSLHNQWLHVLYSTGLIGLLLFVAALALLIRQAGRTYSLVVGCVLLPVFIFSVTERPWPVDTAEELIWAVAGALLSYPVARRLSGDQTMETPSGEPVARSATHRGAQGAHQTETASP
jgi:O-antigen ligase